MKNTEIPEDVVKWLVNGQAFYEFGGMTRRDFKMMAIKSIAAEACNGDATNFVGSWIREHPEDAIRYVLDREPKEEKQLSKELESLKQELVREAERLRDSDDTLSVLEAKGVYIAIDKLDHLHDREEQR